MATRSRRKPALAAADVARIEEVAANLQAPGEASRNLLAYSREVGSLLQETLELVRRSQAQLAEALDATARVHEDLGAILESLPVAVLIVDRERRIAIANRAAVEVAGCAPLEGRPAEAFVGDIAPESAGEIRLGGNGHGERRVAVRRTSLPGEREMVVLDARGATQGEPVDAELARAAARMAHKINNPLTSLIGRAQLLRFVAGTEPQVERAATTIEESARRVSDLVREFAAAVQSADPSRIERAIAADAQAAATRAAGSN